MADRLPSRPPRTNWGNLSKNLALWLLVGLLALALFQMMSRQRNPTQEFSYTEFSRQLDQGNVARVEVFDGKRLEGDFRAPVTQDGRIYILRNEGGGRFSLAKGQTLPLGPNTRVSNFSFRPIVSEDFNGDGAPDIAVTNQPTNTVTIFYNTLK